MSRLEKLLESTLESAGGLKQETLGGRGEISFSEEDKRRLTSQLGGISKFNNGMVVVIIALHVVLFATSIFLVYYFLSDPSVIIYLLGGSVFSIMVVIYSLIRLLKIKYANDFVRASLPYLPPDKAMLLIQRTYFELKKRKPL
jgi:hypothetical protein